MTSSTTQWSDICNLYQIRHGTFLPSHEIVAHEPTKTPSRAILSGFFEIMQSVMERVNKEASLYFAKSAGNSSSFSIKLQGVVVGVILAIRGGRVDAIAREKAESFGLSGEEYLESTRKAEKIALSYFQKDDSSVFSSGNRAEVQSGLIKLSLGMANYGYDSLGFKAYAELPSFTADDLRFFGVDPQRDISDPKKLTCVGFAFFMIREVRAKDLIFFSEDRDTYLRNLVSILKQWDYQEVSQPQSGDLVAYFSEDKAQHLGVFTDSGRVLSKLGVLNSFPHEHGLFDVPFNYGNKVVFFRKPSSLESKVNWQSICDQYQIQHNVAVVPLVLRAHQVGRSQVMATLVCYSVILNHVVESIQQVALEQLSAGGRSRGIAKHDAIKLIDESISEIREKMERGLGAFAKSTGLLGDELYECLDKSEEMAQKYFVEKEGFLLPSDLSEEAIAQWVSETTCGMQAYSYEHLGMKRIQECFSYSADVVEAFKISAKDDLPDPMFMTCLEFAFLFTKETRAREYLFSEKDDVKKDKALLRISSILEGWGYKVVDEPQKSDLVVYFSHNLPSHVGVYMASGLVRSKLGAASFSIHEHGLFDVPPNYGTRVVFYRKTE